MHAGFAFLEAGTVRKKNQVNAMVRVIERDVLRSLGHEDLPPALKPVDHVLS